MKGLSVAQSFGIPGRVLKNRFTNKPTVLSFEVTLSCVARCKHCDTGGYKPNEQRLAPEEFTKYVKELKPAAVQLSGGEPLLREDLPDVARAVKNGSSMPYLIVVSNAYLLNEQRYLELREAGADRFSISLDFPDERHDEFRRLPGLYAHLEKLIPKLASHGNRDIAMNSAITGANFPYLRELADKAHEWGVDISYSAYSIRRTGDPQYSIFGEGNLEKLRESIEEIIELKRERGGILNPTSVLRDTYKFFKDEGIPGCKAGLRFLVVRPDGTINACSMYRDRRYKSQKEMLEDFTKNNECKDCYVAIRAYSDKSLWSLAKDMAEFVRY